MPHPLPASLVGIFAIAAVAGPLTLRRSLPTDAPPVAGQTRTIYVSVTDKSGASVTDMQASEFEVKDGGKSCSIASAASAEIPLRIALLVADQGTGAFQLGALRFMQKLVGHAEFALYSVIIQPEKLID